MRISDWSSDVCSSDLQKVGARRADIACSLADIPAPQKTNLINKAISGYRRELRRGSEDTRLAYVKEAGRFREMARAAASHYRSSVQMLARYTLGSERRSRIIQQRAEETTSELKTLMRISYAFCCLKNKKNIKQ